jgi:hypothetical protein
MTNGGDVVYSRVSSDFQYPIHGGRPASDMEDRKFRQLFLTMLSQDIARSFYDYAMLEDFGNDARNLD